MTALSENWCPENKSAGDPANNDEKKDEWKYWLSLLVLLFTGFVIIRGLVVLFNGESTASLSDSLIGLAIFAIIFAFATRTFLKLSFRYGIDASEESDASDNHVVSPIQKLNPFSESGNKKTDDLRFLNYSGSAATAERLESAFGNDPRAQNVSCNTGYHYTTGESSGNSEESAREGQPEVGVFSMQYDAKDEADIQAIYKRITGEE